MNGRQAGFTYLSVLFAVTVMGIAAAAAGRHWSLEARREREEELLFRGREIRAAIERYYAGSPGQRTYPARLEDLVEDRRYATPRRHLRRIYVDPMTGMADWEAVAAPRGGIMGVRSRSTGEPLKKAGFPPDLAAFEGRESYSEWEFVSRLPDAEAPPGKKRWLNIR